MQIATRTNLTELLEQVVEMTQAQAAALNRQNFDRLAKVTQAKQGLIERLRREGRSALSKPLPPDIKRRLMQIAAMEKYNIRMCTQQEIEIGDALNKIMKSRLAVSNYRPSIATSRFLDQER